MNSFIDSFIAISHEGATFLLVWSWQALVLLTGVWLGLKVCRVKVPDRRYQVWLFGLIAVAVLPAAAQVAQRLPIIQPAGASLNYLIDAPHVVIDLAANPGKEAVPLRVPFQSPEESSFQPHLSATFVWTLLLAAWFVGSLIAFARLAKEQIDLRRARKRAVQIKLSNLDIQDLGLLITAKTDLRLSPEVRSPLLCGVFRFTILLPSDIAKWTSASERAAMIRHEVVHIERFDPIFNLFQTAIRVIFFFHPLVRHACRQLSLERELACDDRVVALGTCARTYAEGLLKVAERSLIPSVTHQLALLSPKQILERRIRMILTTERIRAGARNWKFMVLSGGLVALAAWFLIPSQPGMAQPRSATDKLQRVKTLGDNKAFGVLLEMAQRDPDPELQRLAAVRLTELEGDGSTKAMVELYSATRDPEVKKMLIDTFARISEIEPVDNDCDVRSEGRVSPACTQKNQSA